jgi:aconitate hydratase
VIAESYERIHRSNLVGMGILPLQFENEDTVESLALTGEEIYSFPGLKALLDTRFADGRELSVEVTDAKKHTRTFKVKVRIDTPQEILYYQNGGILQYVLRQLAAS